MGRAKKGTQSLRSFGFVDDPRNLLFKYFLKFVTQFNPKIVLIENVKGLTSASNYRDLIELSLSDTGGGYYVSSEILNARKFGIPQNRERIFFIGVRKDIGKKYKIKPAHIFDNIKKNSIFMVTCNNK